MEENLNIPEAQREDINIQSEAQRQDVNIQRLNDAAERGDINMFENLIEEDPFILQRIDSVPYIQTPLHIAAANGQTHFAMEILSWKSSFFSKFNLEGLSPIHVALKNGKRNVALQLLDANRDQIPCVDRWRIVPIHYVAEQGNIDLLRRFLSASPQSIQDVTTKRETVLHIALKHDKLDTFRYLVRHLQTGQYEGASKQETKILNWKDVEGNTILHIAVVKLLINCGVDVNIMNSDDLTALDILDSEVDNQVGRMLVAAGATSKASSSAQVNVAINSEDDRFSTILSFEERVITSIVRFKRDIENDKRNALLVIVVLIATVTYQASITPPGGVWQDSNSSSATQVHHHPEVLKKSSVRKKEGVTNGKNSVLGVYTLRVQNFFSWKDDVLPLLLYQCGKRINSGNHCNGQLEDVLQPLCEFWDPSKQFDEIPIRWQFLLSFVIICYSL
ncbi:hypothetical protein FNV43_RR09809 [Rhamnella rubrinervis]|uniref:PGG domain-containing protein n=1 Tax=Rhamnella rubrinervis TaxID=2594499 RepID=A0A8K0HBX6_9ROSA|nr:hypothetical protein FNV43_RR09809 [Rhamnella rubrinervis]